MFWSMHFVFNNEVKWKHVAHLLTNYDLSESHEMCVGSSEP